MVRTTNICELKALAYLENKGYEVVKNGYPDFIAIDWKNKKVRFIEVKPASKRLKPRQLKVKEVFRMIGLKYETLFVRGDDILFESPYQDGSS